MIKRRRMAAIAALALSIVIFQLMVVINTGVAYKRPSPYFKVVLMVPNDSPQRVLATQVIARELWKIGIDTQLAIVTWDRLWERWAPTNRSFAEGGWDIWTANWVEGLSLAIYHSAAGYWKMPTHRSMLDCLLDRIASESAFDKAHALILKLLDIAVWECHALTGLQSGVRTSAWDAALRGASHRSAYCPYAYLHFEDNKQSTLIAAVPNRFVNLNPVFGGVGSKDFFGPCISPLYEQDGNGLYRPLLAARDPIPISSTDLLSEQIDLAQISPDSSYAGASTTTDWGPSPNIDSTQYNSAVEAANYSMLLIPLREGIPWHSGYGYTADMKLNVTANDLIWTMSYYLELLGLNNWQVTWGSSASQAIEKINDTLVKVNFRGRTGSGIVSGWRDELTIFDPAPRHVLDPTFNATPYGGNVGVTPDGTTIPSCEFHKFYHYNTGQRERPLLGNGPYCLEKWDESQQLATYTKFTNWGGYGSNSLWNDARFQENNIDAIGIQVMTNKKAAVLSLELEEVDMLHHKLVDNNDISYLGYQPNIQLYNVISGGGQFMTYNAFHPRLNNRYVRLAISHLAPRQRIVDYLYGKLGKVNEVVALPLDDIHYPTEEEWKTLGLDESENVVDPETGKTIAFRGHIRYNVTRAWALMEKAGYNMAPFRDAVGREEAGERVEPEIQPIPIILASIGAVVMLGVALVLSRQHWQHYLRGESEILQLSRQRKQVMDALELKKSPRIGEKAKAQELFRQIVNDRVFSPDLSIFAMLNLCDMLLDEVRAYGEEAVFREAAKLSTKISDIALEQNIPMLRVEALLLRSKFALLKGKIREADQLLSKAYTVANDRQLTKLTNKVAREQSMLENEINRWEELAARAAPLRERLEQSRLQDYIADAVKIIELEETT